MMLSGEEQDVEFESLDDPISKLVHDTKVSR